MLNVPQLVTSVYCGPTAISAVTGVHPSRVVSIIKAARRSERKVIGMPDDEVCNILGLMGWSTRTFNVKALPPYKRATVAMYASAVAEIPYPEIWRVSNHYIAVHNFDALCNQTSGEAVPIVLHPYYRATLRTVIQARRAL